MAAAVGLSLAAGGGSGPPTVLATITTGSAPCGAVSAFGSVWVANDGGTLVRIDPRTNRVREANPRRRRCVLHDGGLGDALWIANYKGGLVRVTPRGRVRRIAVGSSPGHVFVAFGRVWVTTWGDGKVTVRARPADTQGRPPDRRRPEARRPPRRAERRRLGRLHPGHDDLDRARQPPRLRVVERIDVPVCPRRGGSWQARETSGFKPTPATSSASIQSPGGSSPTSRSDGRWAMGALRPGRLHLDSRQGTEHRLPHRSRRPAVVDCFPQARAPS